MTVKHVIIGWANVLFSGILARLDIDTTLKVLGFLFVTTPLGLYHWYKLVDWLKDRSAKRNAS